jgi:hypothetical protein
MTLGPTTVILTLPFSQKNSKALLRRSERATRPRVSCNFGHSGRGQYKAPFVDYEETLLEVARKDHRIEIREYAYVGSLPRRDKCQLPSGEKP